MFWYVVGYLLMWLVTTLALLSLFSDRFYNILSEDEIMASLVWGIIWPLILPFLCLAYFYGMRRFPD